MAVTQYIGARYVPVLADPVEWSSEKSYEPLTIVTYQGASYTSRQAVPVGIEVTNTDYWALTANYDAQVEQYRQEVRQFDQRITDAQGDATEALEGISGITQDVQEVSDVLDGFTETGSVNAAITAVDDKVELLDTNIDARIDGIDTTLTNVNTTLTGFDVDNQVKSYVDSLVDASVTQAKTDILRNPTNMSEVRWGVASRHFRPDGYTVVQGFCVFEVAGVSYWAQGDINTDSDGRIDIYRIDTHNLVGSVSGNFGHVHGISFVNNKLYVDASIAGSSANYVCVNVQNPAAPVILTQYTNIPTVNPVSRICFISDTQLFIIQLSTGNVWLHDLTDGTETLYTTLDMSGMSGITAQDFSYDAESQLFVIGAYHKSGVAIFDANTGDRINFIDVPTIVNHVKIQESEGACVHNGKIYVNASESVYDLRLATLLVWDFANGTAVQSQEMRPSQGVNDRYLRVSVTDTGDLVNPTQNNFRFASDAVNLMRSQGDDFSLHIHVLGSSYSYPVLLQGVFGTVECDEESCVMAAPIIIIGGNVTVLNFSRFTFNAVDSYENAVLAFNTTVLVGSFPTLQGSFVRDIVTNYASTLIISGTNVPTAIQLNRSIAFAKASTNFELNTGSMVYVN